MRTQKLLIDFKSQAGAFQGIDAAIRIHVIRRVDKRDFAQRVQAFAWFKIACTVVTTPWPPQPDELSGKRMTPCGEAITAIELRIADPSGRLRPTGDIGLISSLTIEQCSDYVSSRLTGFWHHVAAMGKLRGVAARSGDCTGP